MAWGYTGGWGSTSSVGYNLPGTGTMDSPTAAPQTTDPTAAGFWSPPTAAPTTAPKDPLADQMAADKAAQQQDAKAIIQSLLDSYGLGSLGDWAWGLISQGASPAQVELQLRQRPEFAARFPGLKMRERNGLPPISPGEYVSYENAAIQSFRQAGLPSDFYTSSDHLANFIGNDVSISELQDRVKNGYTAAMQAPAEVRQQLSQLYGIDAGHLAAFFLDPAQAEPLLMRKFTAAKIGGEAALTGYGTNLGADTLEGLAAQGVTESQAQQGFNKLGMEKQLFGALPGNAGEQDISQGVQLGAEFSGNAEDQKIIENQARGRVAQFGGGYGYAGSATGVSGLGNAKQ